MNKPANFLRDSHGSSAAEFALLLPLLSILLFAFYEAGRLFWTYNIVSNSARDAARFAARLPASCDSAALAGETQVQNLARTGTVDGSGSPLVPGWTSGVTVKVNCVKDQTTLATGRYEGMDVSGIPTVSVTASAPYSVVFGGLFPGLAVTAVAVGNNQPWTE